MTAEVKIQFLKSHSQWASVEWTCKRLHQAGFIAYLAGGCVRDALLEVSPKDFDIATNAHPEEVEKLFPGSLTVGKAFGVVIIRGPTGLIEVASFRKDGPYSDQRRPDHVEFSSPEEDAKRRDFSVNALFFDLQNERLIDFVGGVKDLQNRQIRAVGDPKARFTEDSLRVLRAVRFAVQLNFSIEKMTQQALKESAPTIQDIARERVWQELNKTWSIGRYQKAVQLLLDADLWKELFPELQPFEVLHLLKNLPPTESTDFIWAVLLWPLVQKPEGLAKACRRLHSFRVSHYTSTFCQKLWKSMLNLQIDLAPEDRLRLFGQEEGPYLIRLMAVDLMSKGEPLDTLESWVDEYKQVADLNGRLPKALISGRELMAMGIKSGPQIGDILYEVYSQQLLGKIHTPEQAMAFVRRII